MLTASNIPENTEVDTSDDAEPTDTEAGLEATIPAELAGDVAEGDVIKLKVKSVGDDGTVTVCAVDSDYGEDEPHGVAKMAAEFD